MDIIAKNLQQLQQQIQAAEQLYHRQPDSVQLLAVSKQQTVSAIKTAITAGQNLFGENYVQEAVTKITTINNSALEWHFIGAVQTNKTALIAQYFHWVHSVDRLSIAKRLSSQRSPELPPLNICLQVNIDNEPQKAGVTLQELPQLAAEISHLPRLKLRGLMTIPAPKETFDEQRQAFRQLRLALENLQKSGLKLDTLSMGMSHDFTAAIAEGATIIRIGTAIFGRRVT